MSMMPDNNRFCSRQPNAIPASWSGTGGICPVEAIKVTRELGRVNPFTWIGYRNTYIFPMLGQRQSDCSLRITVFDSIIKQNGKQAEEVIPHSFGVYVIYNFCHQCLVNSFCCGLKGIHTGLGYFCNREFFYRIPFDSFLCTGKLHQIFD